MAVEGGRADASGPRDVIEICGPACSGEDLLGADTPALDRFLGSQLALVFQNPMSSLNPGLSIGTQVTEPAMLHRGLDRTAARHRAVARMAEVDARAAARFA